MEESWGVLELTTPNYHALEYWKFWAEGLWKMDATCPFSGTGPRTLVWEVPSPYPEKKGILSPRCRDTTKKLSQQDLLSFLPFTTLP